MKARILASLHRHAGVIFSSLYLFVILCVLTILIFVRDITAPKPKTLSVPDDSVVIAGQGLDDYYVFARGCVQIPLAPPSCQNDPALDWHNWLEFLRDHYGFGPARQAEFDEWRKTHVRFVRAFTANPAPIAAEVNSIQSDKGGIVLVGYSAGGAAIINYLKVLQSNPLGDTPHILSAVALNAPLGGSGFSQFVAWYVGFDQTSMNDVGVWAKRKNIRLVSIGYINDVVNPIRSVGDVPYRVFPEEPGYAGKFDLDLNHAYFFFHPNGLDGLLRYLRQNQLVRGAAE